MWYGKYDKEETERERIKRIMRKIEKENRAKERWNNFSMTSNYYKSYDEDE